MGRVRCLVGGAQRTIFNDLDSFAPEIANFRSPSGVLRGPEGYVEEGGSGLFPERGQISREISGIVFSSEGSDFQENVV